MSRWVEIKYEGDVYLSIVKNVVVFEGGLHARLEVLNVDI